jgi:hypothetical protein
VSNSDRLNHHFVIALPLDHQYKTTASEALSESPLPVHDTHPANLSRVCRRAAVPPSNFLKRPEIYTPTHSDIDGDGRQNNGRFTFGSFLGFETNQTKAIQ